MMTKSNAFPQEFFDIYRNPGSELEANSVEDVEEIELFTDMINIALRYIGIDYDQLMPRVLINTETGEIGVSLFQVPVIDEDGNLSEERLDKATEAFGYSILIFITKTGVECLAPGYARIRFTDDPNAVPVTAAMFIAAIVSGEPVTFPDLSECEEEAE